MGKVLMGAVVSLDGYIAADDDTVGPLFDWYRNGDVEVVLGDPDRPLRVSAASAAYIRAEWAGVRATVIGRRLFDLTNGWGGVPAVGEHVFVVAGRRLRPAWWTRCTPTWSPWCSAAASRSSAPSPMDSCCSGTRDQSSRAPGSCTSCTPCVVDDCQQGVEQLARVRFVEHLTDPLDGVGAIR